MEIHSPAPGTFTTNRIIMPEEEKELVKLSLNGMMVDPRTKDLYRQWKGQSRRTTTPLFEQLVLFALDNNFNPNSEKARVSWEGGK